MIKMEPNERLSASDYLEARIGLFQVAHPTSDDKIEVMTPTGEYQED
jgi:hypothetical protein